MANLNTPGYQLTNGAGEVAVNGKITVEISGSAGSPKDTFTDIDETPGLENTNPILLDADGKFPFNAFFSGSALVTESADNINVPRVYDPFPVIVSGLDALAAWNGLITYPEDALVTADDGNFYKSVASANTNNNPTAFAGFWVRVRFVGNWITEQSFNEDDIVIASDKNLYLSIAGGNIGNDPVTDLGVNWKATTIDFGAINSDFTFAKDNPKILFNDPNGIGSISADTTTTGARVDLHGPTEPTFPNHTRVFDGTTLMVDIDPVAGVIDLQGNDIATTGTYGAIVSTGLITATGILKTLDDTQATDTSDGSIQTPGGLSVAKDGQFGGVVETGADGPNVNDFRLTLTSGTPVTINVSAAAFIFMALYNGDKIAVFNGTKWVIFTLPERKTVPPLSPYHVVVPAASDCSSIATKLYPRAAADDTLPLIDIIPSVASPTVAAPLIPVKEVVVFTPIPAVKIVAAWLLLTITRESAFITTSRTPTTKFN